MTEGARRWVIAGAATVLLTAASVTVVAAVQPTSMHPIATGTHGRVALGMHGGRVASRCTAPSLPGHRVDVVLSDMGSPRMAGVMMRARMMLHAFPREVPPGTVSFRVVNHGSRTHELVVLPLAAGAAAGARPVGDDGRVDESGSLGEASNDCGPGTGEGIRPGGSGWVTLSLGPGSYELVCNVPRHYAAGMYARLDVG